MEEINKLIGDFVREYEITSMDEFLFSSNLSKIISKYYKDIKYPNYKIYVPLKKSLQYSRDFLETLSPRYVMELDENKDKIIFEKLEHATCDHAYSDYIYETKEKIIYIPYEDSISDTFSITHEIMHSTTMDNDFSITRNVFCEVITLCAEMLQRDYLKEKGIKELNINRKMEIKAVQQFNNINVFQTRLVNEYLENGYISSTRFMDLIEDFSVDDIKTINNHIVKNIKQDNEFDILFLNRYIIGYTLASYLYDKIQSKLEFVDLNDSINEYSICDFLDYLDLEYKDLEYLDLTEESYQAIENSYKKTLKRL